MGEPTGEDVVDPMDVLVGKLRDAGWDVKAGAMGLERGYVTATISLDDESARWPEISMRLDSDGTGYFGSSLNMSSYWTLEFHPSTVAAMKAVVEFREALE